MEPSEDKYVSTYKTAMTLTIDEINHRISSLSGAVIKVSPGWQQCKVMLEAFQDALAKKKEEAEKAREADPATHDLRAGIAKKYLSLLNSAKRRGKDFDLDFSDVRSLITKKHCAYTGVLLTRSDSEEAKLPTDRTVDRVDSRKGYIKGSVVSVSHHANVLKNMILENSESEIRMPFKQLKQMVEALDKMGYRDIDERDAPTASDSE